MICIIVIQLFYIVKYFFQVFYKEKKVIPKYRKRASVNGIHFCPQQMS